MPYSDDQNPVMLTDRLRQLLILTGNIKKSNDGHIVVIFVVVIQY